MKYVVLYQSESGNTKKLAEEIFESIDSADKEIWDIDQVNIIPNADVYFVGFGIHNGNCSMDVIECLEVIEGSQYALFMTCGFTPSEKYKQKLMKNLDVWLPEDSELLDVFICQGKITDEQREIMIDSMPEKQEQLEEMFRQGEAHPNKGDLHAASDFAEKVQKMLIWEED